MSLHSFAQSPLDGIIELVEPHQHQHKPSPEAFSLPIVMYSERPSPETVLEMHEDDVVPAAEEHTHHEQPEGAIEIVLEDLPGVEALDPELEQSLEAHDDTVSSNETMRASDSDSKKSKKDPKWDWESKLSSGEGSHGFVTWIKGKLDAVPNHSGYDTSGIERAISYLERLDNEISKAMRLDLDGQLDADKIEEVRAQMEDGIDRLHARLEKVKAKKGKGKKKKSDVENDEMVKVAQKAAGIGASGTLVVVPLLISHCARVCINGMVSSGYDLEHLYWEQCKKFGLNKREQAELIQLLEDMNTPIRRNRGYMPDEDVDSTQGDFDWISQYQG